MSMLTSDEQFSNGYKFTPGEPVRGSVPTYRDPMEGQASVWGNGIASSMARGMDFNPGPEKNTSYIRSDLKAYSRNPGIGHNQYTTFGQNPHMTQ